MGYICGGLGNAIRAARTAKSITQEQLAELVDISPMFIKQLESERRKPSLNILYRLATVLELSVDEIFFPSNPETSQLTEIIKRSLNKCTQHELSVINRVLETMLEK